MGTLTSGRSSSSALGHFVGFHRSRATACAGLFGAVFAALIFALAHRALGDDAYITLSYARNLAFHGHWGLTEFRTSNSATSPLNVWLLAALTLVIRAPVVACGVLLVLTGAVIGMWSSAIARMLGASWVLPTATVGALLVNPLLVSTIGLETYVGTALAIGLVRYVISGRARVAGIVAGLLVLARPDLGVVGLVIVIGLSPVRRNVLVTGAVGALVALPWHVFSWFALGSAIPDTFAFKTVAGRFSDSTADLVNGLVVLYGTRFPMATAFSLILPVIGVMCLCGWVFRPGAHRPAERVSVVFAAAGVAHWAVLAFVVQADPYSWYYAPLIVGLTMAATCTFGVVSKEFFQNDLRSGSGGGTSAAASLRDRLPRYADMRRYRRPRAKTAEKPPVVDLLSGPAPDSEDHPARASKWAGTGSVVIIAATMCWLVVAAPRPWTTLPMGSNWATSDDYARAGRELRLPPGSVVSGPGEIGTLSYYCRCDIVDWLSDRGRGWKYLEQRERVAGPVMRTLLRWNYQNLPRMEPAEAGYRLKLVATGAEVEDSMRTWPVNTPMHGGHMLVLSRCTPPQNPVRFRPLPRPDLSISAPCDER